MLDMHEVTGSIPVVSTKKTKRPSGRFVFCPDHNIDLIIIVGGSLEISVEIHEGLWEGIRFSPYL